MKKRRAVEGDQSAADEHRDPGSERRSSDDLGAQGSVGTAGHLLHFAKRVGEVKHRDIDAGDGDEGQQQLKGRVVEILLGKAEKEPDAGEEIEHKAPNAERYQLVQNG